MFSFCLGFLIYIQSNNSLSLAKHAQLTAFLNKNAPAYVLPMVADVVCLFPWKHLLGGITAERSSIPLISDPTQDRPQWLR